MRHIAIQGLEGADDGHFVTKYKLSSVYQGATYKYPVVSSNSFQHFLILICFWLGQVRLSDKSKGTEIGSLVYTIPSSLIGDGKHTKCHPNGTQQQQNVSLYRLSAEVHHVIFNNLYLIKEAIKKDNINPIRSTVISQMKSEGKLHRFLTWLCLAFVLIPLRLFLRSPAPPLNQRKLII